MNKKETKNRIHYVDRLKGIAMLLVVMGHVAGFRMGVSDGILTHFIQTCQIPLFMFMFGFLVSTPISVNKKLIKKLLGLVLPLFVFGLGYTFLSMQVNSYLDLLSLTREFLLAPTKNGYWYLMSLSVFYCFMPLFSLNRSGKKWIDIFIAFFIYAICFVGWKKTYLIGDIFCLLNCTDFFPFFITGFFTRKYELIKTTNLNYNSFYINSNWLFSLSLITYLILFNIDIPNHLINTLSERFLIRFCAVIVFCTLIVKRENSQSKIDTALEYIGKNTLDVYVIHYFILQYVCFIMFGQWAVSTGNILMLLLVILVVSIPITYLSIWIGCILRESTFLKHFAFGDFKEVKN